MKIVINLMDYHTEYERLECIWVEYTSIAFCMHNISSASECDAAQMSNFMATMVAYATTQTVYLVQTLSLFLSNDASIRRFV